MPGNERVWLTGRATHERDMAKAAATPAVRAIHARLALLYLQRLSQDDVASAAIGDQTRR